MKRWSVIGAVLLVAVWMVARRDPQLRSYDLAPDHDWQQAGFERLELPIHLPSADPDIDQVEIWIQIPQGQRIDLAADGSATLSFPPGTVLDRVEFAGAGPARQVVDERQVHRHQFIADGTAGVIVGGQGRQAGKQFVLSFAVGLAPAATARWGSGHETTDSIPWARSLIPSRLSSVTSVSTCSGEAPG